MQISRQQLAGFYIFIGISAWLMTSLHLPSYFSAGFLGGTMQFWQDALLAANPAGKFLAVDIFMLGLAVLTWMLLEAQQRNMRGAPIYVLVALLIGISLAVPLFLAHRERAIYKADANNQYIHVPVAVFIFIISLTLLTLAASALTYA